MEVKNRIINKISQIEDESFLTELELIISSLQATENIPYKLSEEMILSVKAADQDIKHGRIISHHQVMTDMKDWLEEK